MKRDARLAELLARLDAFACEHRVARSDRRKAAVDARKWFRECVRRGLAPESVCLGVTSDGAGALMVVVGDAESVAETVQARCGVARGTVH